MYDHFAGTVDRCEPTAVVLAVGGVGYRLSVSQYTRARLKPGQKARLLAHLLVREDHHELFGFLDHEERHLFRQLLLVSGVGPAVALGLLSAYEPSLLASHIAGGDIGPLTKVKGVGKRTGERILVELRDRLAKETGGRAAKGGVGAAAGARGDAVLALCSLGLARAEAEARVEKVPAAGDLAVEEIVKLALAQAR